MPMKYPSHILKNDNIYAEVALPQRDKAYYRGRRFEWSGNILNMTCRGKTIFSPWTAYLGPENHESIAGPMEEFSAGYNDKIGGPGQEEAAPGDPWLKIGVGVLERTATEPFNFAETHPLIEGGEWSWETSDDSIIFTHQLDYPAKGWAYTYIKTITLTESGFILDHRLTNRGNEPLDFMQYNHNFFTLGNCPAGPDWEITFPCELTGVTPFDYYRIGENKIGYRKRLDRGGIMTYVTGDFGSEGYQFSVRNNRDNIQVDVKADSPLEVLKFWSCPTTVCPEPYIHKICDPGAWVDWKIFYTIGTE
jgi:hypothetical protein